jgi:hypothetical protein
MTMQASNERSPIDDAVRRVRSGETGAFEVVVRRFERPLRAWLAACGPPGVDVDEVAQRSFLAAFSRLDEFDISELRQLLAKDDRLLQIAADSYRTHRLLGLHVQDSKSGQDHFVRETMNRLPAEADQFVGAVMRQLLPAGTGNSGIRGGKWRAALAAAVLLVAGVYFFLKARVEPEVAALTEMNGALQWTGDGGRVVRDLEAGGLLHGGTLESLSADSWAVLTFRDGSTVTLSGQSMLTISAGEQKELHLREGNVSAWVAPQRDGSPMLIHTPTAKLEVLGTRLDIEAETSATTLRVNEGRVRVTRLADGNVVEVGTDHQVVASASRLSEFKVTRRPASVSSWQSSLPTGAGYGEWVPEPRGGDGSLRTAPMLLNYQKEPITLHVASLSVSRGSAAPVVLTSGGKTAVEQQPHASPERGNGKRRGLQPVPDSE